MAKKWKFLNKCCKSEGYVNENGLLQALWLTPVVPQIGQMSSIWHHFPTHKGIHQILRHQYLLFSCISVQGSHQVQGWL